MFRMKMKFCPVTIKLISQSTGHFTLNFVIQLNLRLICIASNWMHIFLLNIHIFRRNRRQSVSFGLWQCADCVRNMKILQLRLSTPIPKRTHKYTHSSICWTVFELLLLSTKKSPYQIEYKLLANLESEINRNFMMIIDTIAFVLVKQYKRAQLSSHQHKFRSVLSTTIFFWLWDKNPAFILNYWLSVIRKCSHVG